MLHKRSLWHVLRANHVFVVLALLALLIGVVPAAAAGIDPGTPSACAAPRGLAIGGTLAQSEAWRPAKGEWVQFTVEPNARYRLQVSGAAGLQAALYDRCDVAAPLAGESESVALRDGQIEFTALRGGDYYLWVEGNGAPGYQVTLAPAAAHRPSITAVENVPEDVQRRAAEFLDELRNSELAPEWANARLNPEARILYRPDIQAEAYYEFTVEKPVNDRWEPAGFIQLSAGEHDYVLTQWDTTGMSPTQELAELAPLGVQLTQFYKLNSLSYAAEYEQLTGIGIAALADDVINLGDLPGRITGLEGIPEEPAELVTEGIDSEGKTTREGPTELPLIEEKPWDSWDALKAGYTEDYGPLLKSLKQRASRQWELEKGLAEYGESLTKGAVRTLNGLPTQTLTGIEVSGDGAGAQYLKQERLTDNGTLKGIQLTVLDEPADLQGRLPFQVLLTYGSGASETIRYAIVNSRALNSNDIFLPLLVTVGGTQIDVETAGDVQASGSWGPWHYYWADGDAGSNRYDQFPAYSSPNTSGCWSGCGATAWAMVFGWVDRRAAENHWRWKYQWGIYRQNGGFGANVVAPLPMDTGVRNMTWEIRNWIGTYCKGSGGATKVTTMINAYKYVLPRATTGWRMNTKYDPTGLCWFGACNPAREWARDQIVNYRAPAIIAANNHYPLAYGYAWQSKQDCFLWWCSTSYNRWFYVNQGWGGSGNGWVSWDDVFFAGTFRPY